MVQVIPSVLLGGDVFNTLISTGKSEERNQHTVDSFNLEKEVNRYGGNES